MKGRFPIKCEGQGSREVLIGWRGLIVWVTRGCDGHTAHEVMRRAHKRGDEQGCSDVIARVATRFGQDYSGMPVETAEAGMVSDGAAAAGVAGAWRSLCRKAFRALRLLCLAAQDPASSAGHQTPGLSCMADTCTAG